MGFTCARPRLKEFPERRLEKDQKQELGKGMRI